MADARHAQAELYLNTLFGDACAEGLYFVVHSLPSRRSRFFNKIDKEVIEYIFRECDELKQNVYVGMGLFREPVKGGGRGKSEDVVAIVALYGDFDIKKSPDDVHHPETVEEALELARIGPTKCSMHVLSGSGIHAYWLLAEPWMLSDSSTRAEADTLVKRVSDTHIALSESKGFKLDYMKDLVRVFRVPGTLNYKSVDNLKPVELVMPIGEAPRFETEDFEPYLVAPMSRGDTKVGAHSEPVAYMGLDPSARIDPEMLELAFKADDGFEDTWRMRRAKEFGTDVSRYDQAIANALVDAGWSDEQVATAITHFRRDIAAKPKADPKGRLRLDYYQRTIMKAKNASAGRRAKQDLEEGVLLAGVPQPLNPKTGESNVDSETREKVLSAVRSMLKVDIRLWVQVGLDDPHYYLVTEEGEHISIGGDNEFEKFHLFERKLRGRLGVMIPESVRKSWRVVMEHLNAVRKLDKEHEPLKSDRMASAVKQYLQSKHMMDGEGAGGRSVVGGTPFSENGSCFVWFDDFHSWHDEKRMKIFTNPNEGRTLFKQAGATSKRITATGPGVDRSNRPKRMYWEWPNRTLFGAADPPTGARLGGFKVPEGVDEDM